jgi:hypothetical protein
LTLRPPDSLRVVLAVRRRKEEAEERALAALNQQIQRAEAEAERLQTEIAAVGTSRREEIQQLLNGAHHQHSEARYTHLLQQCSMALAEAKRLDGLRVDQMAAYLAAKCGREVISELQERRTSAYQADLQGREQKRNEDLFLARRARS